MRRVGQCGFIISAQVKAGSPNVSFYLGNVVIPLNTALQDLPRSILYLKSSVEMSSTCLSGLSALESHMTPSCCQEVRENS